MERYVATEVHSSTPFVQVSSQNKFNDSAVGFVMDSFGEFMKHMDKLKDSVDIETSSIKNVNEVTDDYAKLVKKTSLDEIEVSKKSTKAQVSKSKDKSKGKNVAVFGKSVLIWVTVSRYA